MEETGLEDLSSSDSKFSRLHWCMRRNWGTVRRCGARCSCRRAGVPHGGRRLGRRTRCRGTGKRPHGPRVFGRRFPTRLRLRELCLQICLYRIRFVLMASAPVPQLSDFLAQLQVVGYDALGTLCVEDTYFRPIREKGSYASQIVCVQVDENLLADQSRASCKYTARVAHAV